MFEDQTVELLPERTTMQAFFSQNGNLSIAIAINAGNINFGGTQVNTAVATALAGVNVGRGLGRG
ncbi:MULTISPECIES: hypothetical protein [unclassified Geodermatophilus]